MALTSASVVHVSSASRISDQPSGEIEIDQAIVHPFVCVEGSNDGINFKSIAETKFPDATQTDPRMARPFSCNFPPGTSWKYYKFTVANLKKLPSWHRGKGEPAWIFVDEIFLN